MPSSYDFWITGAITKPVRNRARLRMTVFGGLWAMPMAVRSSESTTTMRVNDVTMMRMEGATLKMVMRATICRARSVTPVP